MFLVEGQVYLGGGLTEGKPYHENERASGATYIIDSPLNFFRQFNTLNL